MPPVLLPHVPVPGVPCDMRHVFSFHPCLRNSCFYISMQDGREPAVQWGYFGRISSRRPLLPFPRCLPSIACCRKLLSVCYPLVELGLLTLLVIHLEKMMSIAHQSLFLAAQVQGALWGWWRRGGEGRWLLPHLEERC